MGDWCACCNCKDHSDYPGGDDPRWPCPLFDGRLICYTCCVFDMDADDAPRLASKSPKEIADTCNACGKCGHERTASDYISGDYD